MTNALLAKVSAVSRKYPQLRLGQILECAAEYGGWDQEDLFYVPDETLMNGLNKLLSM